MTQPTAAEPPASAASHAREGRESAPIDGRDAFFRIIDASTEVRFPLGGRYQLVEFRRKFGQFHQSCQHPTQRNPPLESIAAASVLKDGWDSDRLCQQRAKHGVAGGHVPGQQPAPVGELHMQPLLERLAVERRNRRRNRAQFRAEGVCAGIEARQSVQ
jgi:hypothetical protein